MVAEHESPVNRCPLDVSLDIGEALAHQLDFVDDTLRQRALGGIAMTRLALRMTRQEVGCNCNHAMICPLGDMAMQARTFAASRWPESTVAVQLDSGVDVLQRKKGSHPPETNGNYM